MSYSTLYAVYKTRVKVVAEFKNAYGAAPALWQLICGRYLGRSWNAWLFDDDPQWLWDAVDDPLIPVTIRIAHAFTFDLALCRPENRERLALACISTGRTISHDAPERANNWSSIGLALQNLVFDPRCVGVGFGGTSVNDPWGRYPGSGVPLDIFAEMPSLMISGGGALDGA